MRAIRQQRKWEEKDSKIKTAKMIKQHKDIKIGQQNRLKRQRKKTNKDSKLRHKKWAKWDQIKTTKKTRV